VSKNNDQCTFPLSTAPSAEAKLIAGVCHYSLRSINDTCIKHGSLATASRIRLYSGSTPPPAPQDEPTDADAAYRLAKMHDAQQAYSNAAHHYKMAAIMGHAKARYRLGLLHYNRMISSAGDKTLTGTWWIT
jgi:hypothetical protein